MTIGPRGAIEHKDQSPRWRHLGRRTLQFVLIASGTAVCIVVLAIVLVLWKGQSRTSDNAQDGLAHVGKQEADADRRLDPPTAEKNVSSVEYEIESTVLGVEIRVDNPLARKQISESKPPRPRWTATPIPTATPPPTPTPNPTFVSNFSEPTILQPMNLARDEKWIDINLTSQTLVAYEGARPVFRSLVSTGTSSHPTVTGQFRIWLRFRAQDMDGYRLGFDYYLKNVPYVQYFFEDYALHGTFWHNNFGTPMSHGCVNLPTSSAEWLFDWADYGTLLNIHR